MKFLVYPDFGLEKETEISWIILILKCISGDSSSIPSGQYLFLLKLS
ncbi:hypothetical protein SLEP1_g44783 [Rubroshorea leprosula]|uniref:Uncharacterized protein n=1 Tax=Rubroshorea leprosula TaxID=152421 RepID=A0AAV5LII4_9ROSI|nr:hypothetical protein SLEP1_g44783 [Rubroshorea leprosula]